MPCRRSSRSAPGDADRGPRAGPRIPRAIARRADGPPDYSLVDVTDPVNPAPSRDHLRHPERQPRRYLLRRHGEQRLLGLQHLRLQLQADRRGHLRAPDRDTELPLHLLRRERQRAPADWQPDGMRRLPGSCRPPPLPSSDRSSRRVTCSPPARPTDPPIAVQDRDAQRRRPDGDQLMKHGIVSRIKLAVTGSAASRRPW